MAALLALLNASIFLNSGHVSSNDTFVYQAIDCLYLEPENVSLTQNTWAVSNRLQIPQSGPCLYLYKLNGSVPPPPACDTGPTTPGMDRQGYDYLSTPDYETSAACDAACCSDTHCAAWVWVPKAPGPYMGCQDVQKPCCYLKTASPAPIPSTIPGIVSAARPTGPPAPVIDPPTGMRSAVPLGGIGAGSFELRADGTFHEWTVHEASPAGSAKLGVIADMMLGVRVAESGGHGLPVARALRTQSLDSVAGVAKGVDGLTYSGSYPLSRLLVQDAGLTASDLAADISLYAYSRFMIGDLNASAAPAVSFTLTATNPSSTAASDISLFLSLPLSAFTDCYGTAGPITHSLQTPSPAACLQACNSQPDTVCAAWVWESASGQCSMEALLPLIAWRPGWSCGTRGTWQLINTSKSVSALSLTQGVSSQCDARTPNPSPLCGDYGLGGLGDAPASFGAADTLSTLWEDFSATGSLRGIPSSTAAAVGAGVATMTLPPGQSGSVTLVFAWYLPNRDYMGRTLGAWYQNLFNSSSAVLQDVATPAAQTAIVADINAHHAVWAGPEHSEPDWLADVAINSFSHMRNSLYFADGRWRQWEANDCDDIDSVHNDFQRHLIYLWAFPQVELQKSRIWAAFADKAHGFINEMLSVGCLGPPAALDVPGGRQMADVSTVWTLGVLELYQMSAGLGADERVEYVQSVWPQVLGALRWQLAQCNNPAAPGLPYQLVCTYDIEVLEKYPTTTYNSFLHLAMMKAVTVLAAVVNDTAAASQAKAAYDAGVAGVRQQLWNATVGAFRAYSKVDDLPIMSDCLYGIQIAHSLGLGFLWDGPHSDLLSHLAYESQRNLDAYGLQCLTGRGGPMPFAGIDTTHWGMAGPTATYVGLAAGVSDVSAALEPSRRFMDNYRSRLADQWNLAGLTTSENWTFHAQDDGMSWCTSHYGMPLTHYYIHYAMSGQQVNLPAGLVSFAPVVKPPYTVPLLLAGTTGTVSRSDSGLVTVRLAFGSLELPAGGLVVDGSAYPNAVSLHKGQAVSWQVTGTTS